MRSVYDLKTKSEVIMFLLEFRRSLGESINMINHVILYLQYEFFTCRNKKKLNTETQRHGEKNEGGRMMDEKEETSITVSSFITHTF
jgi:hypothetical protein